MKLDSVLIAFIIKISDDENSIFCLVVDVLHSGCLFCLTMIVLHSSDGVYRFQLCCHVLRFSNSISKERSTFDWWWWRCGDDSTDECSVIKRILFLFLMVSWTRFVASMNSTRLNRFRWSVSTTRIVSLIHEFHSMCWLRVLQSQLK